MERLSNEKKNNLVKLCFFMFWFVVGAFIEMQNFVVFELTQKYEILCNLILSVSIPVILFHALIFCKKILDKNKIVISGYYLKSILCMYIGTIIKHMYYSYIGEKYTVFSRVESIMLISFVVIFRIIQKKYQKLQNKELYWWYIVLGLILSANIGYIWENYNHLKYILDEVVKHFLLLLLVILINIYIYIRNYKIQIINNNIDLKEYRCNAIKMTIFTFVLLIVIFKMFCIFLYKIYI